MLNKQAAPIAKTFHAPSFIELSNLCVHTNINKRTTDQPTVRINYVTCFSAWQVYES